MEVQVQILPHGRGLRLPEYASAGSAGLDLRAAVMTEFTLNPGKTEAIPTGLCIALEPGFEGQVRPRSGLALKHGIGILNSPGTIDSDYRGEVKVIISNFSSDPFTVKRGDRIAQLVINRYERISWKEVDRLDSTDRGEGGFGHSGI